MVDVACKVEYGVADIAKGMGIPKHEVMRLFKSDGRHYSHMIKPRLSKELKCRPVMFEGVPTPALLRDRDGGLWHIRTLTKSGVNFGSQVMRSGGIEFDPQKFLEFVKRLDGYLICDIRMFPTLTVYRVYSEEVIEWHKAGELNDAIMPYGAFLERALYYGALV